MGRLIDADALKEWIENWFTMNRHYHPYSRSNNIPTTELTDIIDRMPTVDAVEVIRCGQCKYQDKGESESGSWNCCSIGYCNVEDDYFCWWAERRQDE